MKRITSFTLSAVTALGLSVSAPAAAGNDDLAKILGGILVLGIAAKAIDNRRDKRKAAQTTTNRFPRLGSIDDYGNGIVDGRLSNPNLTGPKPGRGYKKQPLPQQCLRVFESGRRDRNVYGNRCLARNYKHAAKLPEHCAFRVRTERGIRTVFGARCLLQDGWKVAGRR